MRWVTRSHLHLDRAASPWLIRRFVDPDASFEFVGWEPEPELPDGAIPFGLRGVELSAHDENGTTFEKVIRKYGLEDPALHEMARIVSAGVRWALKIDPPAEQSAAQTALGRALDGLGSGMGVFNDDQEIIRISTPMYNALYVLCQMTVLDRDERKSVPRDPARRQAFWRQRLVNPAS